MDSINNACKLSSNAWLELQAFKTRQLNRREKLSRCKSVVAGLPPNDGLSTATTSYVHQNPIQSCLNHSATSHLEHDRHNRVPKAGLSGDLDSVNLSYLGTNDSTSYGNQHCHSNKNDDQLTNDTGLSEHDVECLLLLKLCDVALKLPIDSKSLQRFIMKVKGYDKTPQSLIVNLLQKFAHQELITIEEPNLPLSNRHVDDYDVCIHVTSADHTKLVEFDKSFGSLTSIRALLLESKQSDDATNDECDFTVPIQSVRSSNMGGKTNDNSSNRDYFTRNKGYDVSNTDHRLRPIREPHSDSAGQRVNHTDDIESLLSLSSTRERESKKLGEELLHLLSKPTYRERNLLETFRSADGYQVQEFCPKGTKIECIRNNRRKTPCSKLHFKKIIANHTEESLGDCSFLNTCFHMDSCKYVHYEVDYDESSSKSPSNSSKRPNGDRNSVESAHLHISKPSKLTAKNPQTSSLLNAVTTDLPMNKNESMPVDTISREYQSRLDSMNRKRFKSVLYPPQWIQCDLRYFDMSLLGKFSVVMADPPWDIHMELPYGTMSDEEMRKLNIPALQDEGVIFLWVTGRAMELGRECLSLWGYERCDEIIWVKTNQLQRIIRTGRTGHWLNHGKEHCLVGVKGNPKDINRGLDCDVIVAEVRATSHKPDEIYGIIERLSPGTKKIELFGRPHNVQPNWITLGNQLNGVRLKDPNLISAFKKLDLPFQSAG